jgi:endonuclease YncB( thermonuclease family)
MRNSARAAVIAIATTLALVSSAGAYFYTGNELLDMCAATGDTTRDFQHRARCQAYITGVYDGGSGFCSPDRITQGQVRDMIVRALQTQPHRRHLPASELIIDKLKRVWPCKPAAMPPQDGEPTTLTVIDGDTIRVGDHTMRLVGFDTPETTRAQCPQERALGERAKERLRQLVASDGISWHLVACACRAGTEGTQACNRGRSCAQAEIKGRNVGEILIEEGLARPFHCGPTSCPPRQPWCQ